MKRYLGLGVLAILIAIAIGPVNASPTLAERPSPSLASRGSGASLRAWLTPERVVPEGAHVAEPRNPALVLDANTHTSHLAWEEDGYVRYAWRRDGVWQLDETLWRGDSPALALDVQGVPHLVYVDLSPFDEQLQIFYVRYEDGVWSLPQNVSGTLGPSTAPDISIVISLDIHIVWSERLDRSNRIYHAFSQDGGVTWSQVMPIPDSHGYAPALAAGNDGIVWAAWQGMYDITDDTSSIWVAQWDGANWSAPENITEGISGSSHLPDLLVAPDGGLLVAWEQELFPGTLVVMFREGHPQAWSAPAIVSDGPGTEPALAPDSSGHGAVAWDAGNRVGTRNRLDDGTWGVATYIGENVSGIRDVALSASSQGILDIAWCSLSDLDTGAVWFATQLLDTTPEPSPSATITATDMVTPTSAQKTETAIPVETLPAPTETMSSQPTVQPPTPSQTPFSTYPEPTVSVPTVEMPFSVYMPAMQGPIESSASVEAAAIARQPDAPVARIPKRSSPAESQESAHDPWRWYGSTNVSSSGMASRDVTAAWLSDAKAVAVWAEALPACSLLSYSVLEDGEWSSATPFYVGEAPDIAVDDAGGAHLVFSNEFGGAYDVFYAEWTGTQWGPPQNVSNTSGNSSHPAITIRDDGVPVIVWSDTTENAHRIYYGWLEDGLWSTYLIHGSVQGLAPDIVVSKDQRVWATWQALEPWGKYEVYASWGDGESWQNFAILVSGDDQHDSMAPRMASSRERGAYLVWQEGNGSDTAVHYSDNLADNYWWASPTKVSGNRGDSQQPDVQVRPSGQAYVAWEEAMGLAITSRYPSETDWLFPTLVIDDGAALASPVLAVDSSARLLALWAASPSEGVPDIHGQQGLFEPPYGVWLPRASADRPHLARVEEAY